ncbi:LysR family transcriptional regulator [Lactococcus sp. DD01]|uniref:LysR family transcriptional regulator n=1 Tax=Lactococcus sp. DD01 TaxID=1776443 RepID=UPI000776604C|nr:LysR family transcriptional regulator [Lactococcus sp. DD01]KXT59460.1 hypothetical protein LACDD01_02060 [Lactococcus sp. DD01]
MNISHLEYFIALVSNDFNITKTAQLNYISQPALSKIINSLEALYDVELFIRQNRRIVGLTALGYDVYSLSLQTLEAHHTLLNYLTSFSKKEELKIGVPPPLLPSYVSNIILELFNRHPQMQISIIEEGGVSLKQKLHSGEIDIAFIATTPNDTLNYIPIFDDEIVAYMEHTHILNHNQKNVVTLQEVNSQVLCTLGDTYLLSRIITKHFLSQKLTLNSKIKSSSLKFLIGYCLRFHAITLLPTSSFSNLPNKNQLAYKPLSPPLNLTIYMCYSKNNEVKIAPIKNSILQIKKEFAI